jgi:hypothetical protein
MLEPAYAADGLAVRNNPYVDEDRLEDRYVAMMQAQERVAIIGMLHAQRMRISGKQEAFTSKLHEQAARMRTYATGKATSDLQEGLEGKAADSVDEYLSSSVRRPAFHNLITSK